jgi:GntR family transcriptional regulator
VHNRKNYSSRPLYLQVRDVLATPHCQPGMEAQQRDPQRGRSGPRVRRQFRHHAQGARPARSGAAADRRQGRGTFVNDQASDDLSTRYTRIWGLKGERITGDISLARVVEDQANEAERLRLQPSDRVHRVQRVRAYKGEPFLVEDIALPAALFPGLAARRDTPPRIVSLAQEFGILLGKCEERVYVGTAAADVAQHLRLAPDAAVLVLDRLIYGLDGRPVEWRLGRGNFVGKYYLAEFA